MTTERKKIVCCPFVLSTDERMVISDLVDWYQAKKCNFVACSLAKVLVLADRGVTLSRQIASDRARVLEQFSSN